MSTRTLPQRYVDDLVRALGYDPVNVSAVSIYGSSVSVTIDHDVIAAPTTEDAERILTQRPRLFNGAPDEPWLMTTRQAAERIGVTYHTVFRWITAGDLAAIKVGTRWRISSSVVDELIDRTQHVEVEP